MELNDLEVFAAVAETVGISAAAKRMGLPKSTVSRSLTRLEKALGVILVHRTTRKVGLTSAGEALHARSAPPLAALRGALRDLPEREEQPSGRLRVAAPVDFGATVLADVVTRFTARHPSVELDVQLSNSVVDLVAEGVDLAVRISGRPLRNSSLVARRAGSIAMHLFASPHYLARRGTPRTPDDLAAHDWVLFRGLRTLELRSGGVAERVTGRGHLHCDDMFFARACAEAGAGVALLPTFLAKPEVAAGLLVRVLPRWTLPMGTVWIVHAGGRAVPPKVTAFRDFVLDALKQRALA